MVLFEMVVLNESVLLKELRLKELLEELLFSPTGTCNISLFGCCLEGGRCNAEDSENRFLSMLRLLNTSRVPAVEEKRGCCSHGALLASARPN